MSKTSKTIKERAFWHWEYLRRNQDYQKWSSELPVFLKEFAPLREKVIYTADAYKKRRAQELDLLHSYAPTIFESVKDSRANTSKLFFLPANEFELRFNRIYKHHGIGMDVEKEFSALLRGNKKWSRLFEPVGGETKVDIFMDYAA